MTTGNRKNSRKKPLPGKAAIRELMGAAQNGETDIITAWVLAYGREQVDIRDEYDRTALVWAAADNRIAAATLLLNHGASPDSAAKNGLTPLTAASLRGNIALIEILAKRGADMEKSFGGQTPLQIAASYGNADVAKTLLKYGADAGVRTKDGESVLEMARFWKQEELDRPLLEENSRRVSSEAERLSHEGLPQKISPVRKIALRRAL